MLDFELLHAISLCRNSASCLEVGLEQAFLAFSTILVGVFTFTTSLTHIFNSW